MAIDKIINLYDLAATACTQIKGWAVDPSSVLDAPAMMSKATTSHTY